MIGRMSTATRPLTDLTLIELHRALRATIAAAGLYSASANLLRRAIAVKEAERRRRAPDAAQQPEAAQ